MLLCQGPAWQRFAVDCVGFKIADAPLVPNWTATPALLAIGRDRLPHPIDQPVRLLFVGWLEEKKGVLELIEACRQLVSSSKFVLNIVGEGNASSAAREQVSRAHLESVITFSGWLTGSHLEKAYAEADVFVLPSWAEGLPNAMIEAMAARLAIVVSAVGNIPDVVVDGRDVLLVPPQDIPALRGTLMRVIDDPALRRQLGDAAFTTAERQFGAEQAADRLLCAVDDVVSRFGRVRAGQRARV